jgi:release factor glutamine methyltransferase
MPTIKELQTEYAQAVDFLDSSLLIAHILKKEREFVLTYPEYKLTKHQTLKTREILKRRAQDEPLAYILGAKEFFGLTFHVSPNTLIPRPETEQIVEEVLSINPIDRTIVDIGTGSGNIIITLAKKLPEKNKFIGIDISHKALAVAKKNASANQVADRIKFITGNLLEPILQKKELIIHNSAFIILANLPYLDKNWKKSFKKKESAGLRFEPASALYGGPDGLAYYRKLSQQIKKIKKINPLIQIILFCEIEHPQRRELERIFSFAQSAKPQKDLAGKWRIVKITF